MNFKDLKKVKVEHVIIFLFAAMALFYLWNSYNSSLYKDQNTEQMSLRRTQQLYQDAAGAGAAGVQPSMPMGQNETYAPATGMSTSSQGMPPSCSREPVADPKELLPKDMNSEFAQLNPSGSGDLANVNLLRSGYHMGIDTIGNTLRNANLQLRSEPANPQLSVGPWNNTTIAPDTMRVPLEIGQGQQ